MSLACLVCLLPLLKSFTLSAFDDVEERLDLVWLHVGKQVQESLVKPLQNLGVVDGGVGQVGSVQHVLQYDRTHRLGQVGALRMIKGLEKRQKKLFL